MYNTKLSHESLKKTTAVRRHVLNLSEECCLGGLEGVKQRGASVFDDTFVQPFQEAAVVQDLYKSHLLEEYHGKTT